MFLSGGIGRNANADEMQPDDMWTTRECPLNERIIHLTATA